VAKTTDICVEFLFNVACQKLLKLLKLANVLRSYLEKKWHVFMDRGVKGNTVFA